MSLIKSISGIRGTIGGKSSDNLTPLDIVKFSSAFGSWLQNKRNKKNITLVIGRDARISGQMVSSLVVATLQGLGVNVVDLGLSTNTHSGNNGARTKCRWRNNPHSFS